MIAKRDAQPPAGISLLEVLVSIGVLSVGLLGAATMLPLANYYSQQASNFDHASTLGAQAYHDMQIRGYLSPKRWIDPKGAFTYTNQSVVIVDPLALTYAAANGTASPVYFPGIPNNGTSPPIPTSPIIFRMNVDVADTWPESSPMPAKIADPIAMPYTMADRIFRSTDDPIFDRPDRPDLRPQSPSGGLSPDYAGDYSWIVTVSHTPADIFNAPDMHRLQCSVVVFYKRDLNLNAADWPGPPTQQKPPPERIVYADFQQTVADGVPFFAGGSLLLRTIGTGTPPSTTPDPSQKNWLDGLKPNTYVMLSANFIDTITTSGAFPRVGWYRIVSVDAGAVISGSTATRMITVEGADWAPFTATMNGLKQQVWQDADGGGTTGITGSFPTVFCTIADGAVAVYDDVITLDNSLLRN